MTHEHLEKKLYEESLNDILPCTGTYPKTLEEAIKERYMYAVHATRYLKEKIEGGLVNTFFDKIDIKLYKDVNTQLSFHFAINHLVNPLGLNVWDTMPYCIIMNMADFKEDIFGLQHSDSIAFHGTDFTKCETYFIVPNYELLEIEDLLLKQYNKRNIDPEKSNIRVIGYKRVPLNIMSEPDKYPNILQKVSKTHPCDKYQISMSDLFQLTKENYGTLIDKCYQIISPNFESLRSKVEQVLFDIAERKKSMLIYNIRTHESKDEQSTMINKIYQINPKTRSIECIISSEEEFIAALKLMVNIQGDSNMLDEMRRSFSNICDNQKTLLSLSFDKLKNERYPQNYFEGYIFLFNLHVDSYLKNNIGISRNALKQIYQIQKILKSEYINYMESCGRADTEYIKLNYDDIINSVKEIVDDAMLYNNSDPDDILELRKVQIRFDELKRKVFGSVQIGGYYHKYLKYKTKYADLKKLKQLSY